MEPEEWVGTWKSKDANGTWRAFVQEDINGTWHAWEYRRDDRFGQEEHRSRYYALAAVAERHRLTVEILPANAASREALLKELRVANLARRSAETAHENSEAALRRAFAFYARYGQVDHDNACPARLLSVYTCVCGYTDALGELSEAVQK